MLHTNDEGEACGFLRQKWQAHQGLRIDEGSMRMWTELHLRGPLYVIYVLSA